MSDLQRQVGESYKDYAARMAGTARAAEIDRDTARSERDEIGPTPSAELIEALEALPLRVRETREAMKRLGEAFDRIDAETRRPGEPPLRRAIAQYAREQLAAQPDTTTEEPT